MLERQRIIYSGQVQGVGFRATALRLAQPLAVAGWVKNLPNGSVELVVEGEVAVLQQLRELIAQQMQGYIQNSHMERETPEGLQGFRIRY